MKFAAVLLAATLPLTAQWLDHKDPRTPRTKDGKANLTAPAPRMNGKLDLSGVWHAERTPLSEMTRVLGDAAAIVQVDLNDVTKYVINVFWDVKPGEEPLRPDAAAVMKQRIGMDFVTARCLPGGVPAGFLVEPFKIIQAPRQIAVISGIGDPTRQIYTDDRSLPGDPEPAWMGYSVGKWQGDALVVETVGITEKSWLDAFGHPRSQSMRIREVYRRRDFGHMDFEVTFDDPAYYTRPFSIKTELLLLPDTDVLEYVCTDNEKDRTHTEHASAAASANVLKTAH
jgi:hypothetical protein